jgi:predicted small integral membrane protein
MTAIRAIQLIGVLGIGLLTAMACFNNLTDYGSNFAFVEHVLSMDTTFPDNSLRWRAIQSPALHHLAYWLIIAAEGLAGILCLAGASNIFRHRNDGADDFHKSKTIALWGLTIALALYLIGFMVVGAEWFAMWQSPKWRRSDESAVGRFATVRSELLLVDRFGQYSCAFDG